MTEKITKNSKNKIKETALMLFTRHGFDNTSIRMIASHANISIGLMYNYYKSKDNLLRSIFHQELYPVKSAFQKEETYLTTSHMLESVIKKHFKIVRKNLRFWRLYYCFRMQPVVLQTLDIDASGLPGFVYQELDRYFNASQVKDPGIETSILYSIIDGITLHFVLAPNRYPLKEALKALLKQYTDEDDISIDIDT